jgi:hypothetical protein
MLSERLGWEMVTARIWSEVATLFYSSGMKLEAI